MKFFEGIDSETEMFPLQDPEVVRLQGALHAAHEALAPAAQAWKDYCAARADENRSVPFSREKQRLFDQFTDGTWAVEDAEAALKPVVEAATQRATAAWDTIVRQQFLDDVPVIEGFIKLLAKYEETITEAQLAGVSHVVKVPVVFLTAEEVRTRLSYAKKELGLP